MRLKNLPHLQLVLLLSLAAWSHATSILRKPLAELVFEADHILIAKITKVEMVDDQGRQEKNFEARTGPGSNKQLRLHIDLIKNGQMKSNATNPPSSFIIPLWQKWHYSLGQWKELEGNPRIFLLKGPRFERVYHDFIFPSSQRVEIESLIRVQSERPELIAYYLAITKSSKYLEIEHQFPSRELSIQSQDEHEMVLVLTSPLFPRDKSSYLFKVNKATRMVFWRNLTSDDQEGWKSGNELNQKSGFE